MTAYYNEIDPFAAEWLRNLIAFGFIADGEVDTRDIRDVSADDLRGFSQCHFFAGIGGWSLALRLAGWPDDRPVWTGSCPCQPFSVAGQQKGGADDRHLWPVWSRLIRECRPPVVLGEQVAGAIGHGWLDSVFADLEAEDYACGAIVLPACSVGAPHIRQRLWFVADREGHGRREGRALPSWDSAGIGAQGARVGSADDGSGSALAHDHDHGREGEPGAGLRRPELHDPDGCGEVGLADRKREGLEIERIEQARGQREAAERSGEAGELGDAIGAGGWRNSGAVSGTEAQGGGGRRQHGRIADKLVAPGEVGPWGDLEWLPCRDGKARPVEPGAFPLAHGVPGRVGRLRAYGNAIVPQVAAEVIAAFMERRP